MTNISFTGFINLENIKKPQYCIEQILLKENDRFVRDILPLKISDFEVRRLEWEDFVGKPKEDSYWIAHCNWGICYDYQMIDEKEEIPIKKQQSPKLKQSDCLKQQETQSQKQSSNLENKNYPITSKNSKQQSPQLPPKLLNPKQNNQRINNRLIPSVPKQKTSSVSGMTKVSTPKNSSPQKSVTRSNSSSKITRASPIKQRIKLNVKCKFSEKSWAKPCSTYYEDLLEHETGHYLIGCLCALEFKRQVEQLRVNKSENHSQEIKSIFQTNFRNFLKIEKDYDEETQHYCDEVMQRKWNHKIKEQLLLYEMYFNN